MEPHKCLLTTGLSRKQPMQRYKVPHQEQATMNVMLGLISKCLLATLHGTCTSSVQAEQRVLQLASTLLQSCTSHSTQTRACR